MIGIAQLDSHSLTIKIRAFLFYAAKSRQGPEGRMRGAHRAFAISRISILRFLSGLSQRGGGFGAKWNLVANPSPFLSFSLPQLPTLLFVTTVLEHTGRRPRGRGRRGRAVGRAPAGPVRARSAGSCPGQSRRRWLLGPPAAHPTPPPPPAAQPLAAATTRHRPPPTHGACGVQITPSAPVTFLWTPWRELAMRCMPQDGTTRVP